MRLILPIITIILFSTSYWICELLFPGDIDKWWICKTNLMSVNFLLALYCTKIKRDRFSDFIINCGIGFSVSDVIDRIWFDTRIFTFSDIGMISVTIIVSLIDYRYAKNN